MLWDDYPKRRKDHGRKTQSTNPRISADFRAQIYGKQDQIDRTRPVEGWKLLYADRGAIELAKKRADGQVEKSGAWKGDPFEKILITEFSR